MKKNILITGASSGIGAACVEHAATLGLQIIATARNKPKLQKLQQTYNYVQIIVADISTESGRNKIVQDIKQPLDYFLHNAARLDQPCSFADTQLTDFRQNIATNVEPIIFLTQKLLHNLNKNTRILSVSSGAAQRGIAGIGNYCISKAAGLMANEILKVELQRYGILVNNYFPGVVDTNMQKTLRSSNDDIFPHSEEFKSLKFDNKLSNPLDVAKHIIDIFINSQDNKFINNQWVFKPSINNR